MQEHAPWHPPQGQGTRLPVDQVPQCWAHCGGRGGAEESPEGAARAVVPLRPGQELSSTLHQRLT